MRIGTDKPALFRYAARLFNSFFDRHLFFKIKASRAEWEKFIQRFTQRIKVHFVFPTHKEILGIQALVPWFVEKSGRVRHNANICLDIIRKNFAGIGDCLQCSAPSSMLFTQPTLARAYCRGMLCDKCFGYVMGTPMRLAVGVVTPENVSTMYRCLYKAGKFPVEIYASILGQTSSYTHPTFLLHLSMGYTVLPKSYREVFPKTTIYQLSRLMSRSYCVEFHEMMEPMIAGGFLDSAEARRKVLDALVRTAKSDDTRFFDPRLEVWGYIYNRFGPKLFEENRGSFSMELRCLAIAFSRYTGRMSCSLRFKDRVDKVVSWIMRHKTVVFKTLPTHYDSRVKDYRRFQNCLIRCVWARIFAQAGLMHQVLKKRGVPVGVERIIQSFIPINIKFQPFDYEEDDYIVSVARIAITAELIS